MTISKHFGGGGYTSGVSAVVLLLLVGAGFGPASVDAARLTVKRGNLVSSVEQFPFIVMLAGVDSICTGSLISPRTVLSAGHCACGQSVLNNALVNTLSIEEPRQVIPVQHRYVHPAYRTACLDKLQHGHSNLEVGDMDVALFRLAYALTIRPVASFALLDFANRVAVGTQVIVAGFGLDEQEIQGRQSGLLKWGAMHTTECAVQGQYGPICVPYQSFQNAGPGDSGGPMMRPDKVIVATVSGLMNYEVYQEVIYAPVLPHFSFIKKYV